LRSSDVNLLMLSVSKTLPTFRLLTLINLPLRLKPKRPRQTRSLKRLSLQ